MASSLPTIDELLADPDGQKRTYAARVLFAPDDLESENALVESQRGVEMLA